jgi:hypothetical protein
VLGRNRHRNCRRGSCPRVPGHLPKLRLAGLVQVRRAGTFAYYVAANTRVERLLNEALSHADHATRRVDSKTPHRHEART